MNETNWNRFCFAYREGLRAANKDESYGYLPAEVEAVASKMLQAIADRPYSVSYEGGGFRRACKAVGIKQTRKAILAFLGLT